MYIIKKRKKGSKTPYYSVAETVYVRGKPRQKVKKYLGKAETIFLVFEKSKKKKKSV